MDGDAHVHVHGDHVFYCGYHLRLESIQAYLRVLFKKASLEERSLFVNLEHVASNDIAKQVEEEGVGAIGLNASMYKASTYNKNTTKLTEKILSGVASNFKSFFSDGNTIKDANKMAGLSANVEFKIDKRTLKGSAYNPLQIISDGIIDELDSQTELDSFYVRTLEGNIIRGSKFLIRQMVNILEDGQTVNCIQAWNSLINFKAGLAKGGKITL